MAYYPTLQRCPDREDFLPSLLSALEALSAYYIYITKKFINIYNFRVGT
jgi:hypothetical protein